MFAESLVLLLSLYGQTPDSSIERALPVKYYHQVTRKAERVTEKIDYQSLNAVNTLLEREERMKRKLARVDQNAADRIFQSPIDSLRQLSAKLQHKLPLQNALNNHNESLDSLANTLSFLRGNKLLTGAGDMSRLEGADQAVKSLEEKFQSSDQVGAFLQAQKVMLNEQLSSYGSLAGELRALNQQAYYYTQQLNEYKALLHDRKRAEAKAMAALQQLPAYKQFMAQHSQLAMLLNLQGAATSQSLEGLQTRNAVEQTIQQRLGGAGAAAVTQQMDAAREQLQSLKSKYAGLNNVGEMPDFKPKEMKTKSLRQRLEFGANVQFQKSTVYFPTTGDFAGQAAYKFSKKGSAGLGLSYRLGMGNGFKDIHFTSQGLGLRSFMDWQMKGSIYVNGGFEENYNATFGNLGDLRHFRNWTGSALAGISKKYQISPKMKGNVMLLYDFLWAMHNPTTQPLVLRMGYAF